MGMAASQARLLTITARLADNELRSQTINNAKMRLAAQSSQVSENYINALNNATLMFGNYDEAGNELSQVLTYNALTAYSSYNTQYGLVNSSGQILVSESEAAMFQNAHGNLNAYLKSHGLEYTTTYFEEMGNLENEAYPAPFNSIEYEEMQLYYEQYNSYENSLEVEEYEKNYSAYIKSSNDLADAAKESMEKYLSNPTSNSPKINIAANGDITFDSLSGSTAAELLNAMKNAFKNSGNTYSYENLASEGFISEEVKNAISDEIMAYKEWNGSLPGSTDVATQYKGISYTQQVEFSASKTNEDGSIVYRVGNTNITVNSSGNVIAAEIDAEYTTDGYTPFFGKAQDGTVSLADFVSAMGYTITETTDDGTITDYYQYGNLTYTADGKPQSVELNNIMISGKSGVGEVEDLTNIRSEFDSLLQDIVNLIKAEANYENFAQFLLDNTSSLSGYGININDYVGDSSNTLKDYLVDYTDAKDAFLDNIFSDEALTIEDASGNIQYVSGVDTNPPHDLIYTSTSGSSNLSSKDIVEEDLKNGYSFTNDEGETVVVTAENLTDIDFVLQYLKHRGLTQSESFNTVIKEFLVEQMISIYGEPKYAWVDENDLNNTGNADAKAQWYTNLFNRMMQGYKVLENGLASSSEWIEYALESGIVSLEQVDKSYNWDSLDYKTCTKITEETVNDEITKAEAEYNRAMKDIEAKDNIYDIELKNIDTEHSSLQTEYESIKSVISKNIERTFKFNQSA